MSAPESVRLDKWLWAVRLYSSRSAASQACHAGHVNIDGRRVKPARDVRMGETIVALVAGVRRTIEVLALLDRRVGAKLVSNYFQDLTPPEEFDRAREVRRQNAIVFPQGFGRPTKKQRRLLDEFNF